MAGESNRVEDDHRALGVGFVLGGGCRCVLMHNIVLEGDNRHAVMAEIVLGGDGRHGLKTEIFLEDGCRVLMAQIFLEVGCRVLMDRIFLLEDGCRAPMDETFSVETKSVPLGIHHGLVGALLFRKLCLTIASMAVSLLLMNFPTAWTSRTSLNS